MDEFKSIGEAVGHLETKMAEFKSATTKEAQEGALKECKAILDKSSTEFKGEWEKLQKDVSDKGATIGEMQGELKELKAKSGRLGGGAGNRIMTIGAQLADMILEHKARFENMVKGNNFGEGVEIKTVANIATANLASGKYDTILDWRPGMEPHGQFHFRDIPQVRTIQSDTDFVKFPRANIPIGEGSFAKVAEGVAKPQIDRDYTMIELTLSTYAGYAIVSRQSLRNIPFLQSWLPTSMMEQLMDYEDTDFSNTLVAAATGSSTTTGITVTPERLIYFIKNLMVKKYRPNAILADPAVWASLLVFRPGTDNPYSMPAVTSLDALGTVRVLGIPVYPVAWLENNRVIIGDFSKLAIVQSEGLTFRQTDSHASTFTTNEVTFLVERVEGLAIFRPDAFIQTTL